MQTIDVRGQKCPAPLIATRKLLKETSTGNSFEVITDSKSALENISRFLNDNGIKFNVRENSTWTITVTKHDTGQPLLGTES
jgi:TusA-related sulfurtransferase